MQLNSNSETNRFILNDSIENYDALLQKKIDETKIELSCGPVEFLKKIMQRAGQEQQLQNNIIDDKNSIQKLIDSIAQAVFTKLNMFFERKVEVDQTAIGFLKCLKTNRWYDFQYQVKILGRYLNAPYPMCTTVCKIKEFLDRYTNEIIEELNKCMLCIFKYKNCGFLFDQYNRNLKYHQKILKDYKKKFELEIIQLSNKNAILLNRSLSNENENKYLKEENTKLNAEILNLKNHQIFELTNEIQILKAENARLESELTKNIGEFDKGRQILYNKYWNQKLNQRTLGWKEISMTNQKESLI